MAWGMGLSAIGRLLGVSDVAALKRVRAQAASLSEPEVSAAVVTVEVDEMWPCLKKVCQAVGLARL